MSVAKVLIFAAADPTGQTHTMLRDQGCDALAGPYTRHKGNFAPHVWLG